MKIEPFKIFTFLSPRRPLIWLVITLIDTADVNAAITGADIKFVKNPVTKNHISYWTGLIKY